ncbi:MAG TPA: hypothetical protein VKT49_10610 [Bryobacteraceae bacterium]|nr:hypothetical protein [Bryobacteraceae bacterium]
MNHAKQLRRHFLRNACILAGAGALSSRSVGQDGAQPGGVKLTVGDAAGQTVPLDFIGLSYENMQLEDPKFFSPANRGLVEQFRNLSPRGVLRLGGNTSEFGWWKARSADEPPNRNIILKDGSRPATYIFAITPETIRQLDGFLQATGWTCIYGLNLGYGNPETDIPEARFVLETLGPRLQYFQIGNEVDNFIRYKLREPAEWNTDRYLEEWLVIARAVERALPEARFGLPDVASDVTWLTRIADLWAAVKQKPNVTTLSHHHYWGGPPSNPQANIPRLMMPDETAIKQGAVAREAAQRMNTAYRMTEGNTVFRGGKPGLSDVFASALWSANYLLQLMSMGYSGVNLHGGSGHAQAVSVGGSFVGEAEMKDPNEPHPKPFYTPIANEGTLAGSGVDGKLNDRYLLEPVGYGMKFASRFVGATLLKVDFDPGPVNAVAYAARQPDGRRIVAILNKDDARTLTVNLGGAEVREVLAAPALDAKQARLLAGAEAAAQVAKTARSVTVPKHTAVLVELPGT